MEWIMVLQNLHITTRTVVGVTLSNRHTCDSTAGSKKKQKKTCFQSMFSINTSAILQKIQYKISQCHYFGTHQSN